MRILALDIGEKRIGVAITDKDKTISYPLTTIENDDNFKLNIYAIIEKYNIEKIVIGIPYNLKGEESYQAEKIIKFTEENLKDFKVPIVFFDERFTTKISSNILLKSKSVKHHLEKQKKSDKKNKANKDKIAKDKIAAAIILKDYLENYDKK